MLLVNVAQLLIPITALVNERSSTTRATGLPSVDPDLASPLPRADLQMETLAYFAHLNLFVFQSGLLRK